jgi:hypothetical protein
MSNILKNALGGLAVGIYAGVAGLVVARIQKRPTKGWYCLLWCSIAGAILGTIAAVPTLAYCLHDLIKDIRAAEGRVGAGESP